MELLISVLRTVHSVAGEEVRETVFYYRGHTLMAVRYRNYKAHYVTRSGWQFDPPEVSWCPEQ